MPVAGTLIGACTSLVTGGAAMLERTRTTVPVSAVLAINAAANTLKSLRRRLARRVLTGTLGVSNVMCRLLRLNSRPPGGWTRWTDPVDGIDLSCSPASLALPFPEHEFSLIFRRVRRRRSPRGRKQGGFEPGLPYAKAAARRYRRRPSPIGSPAVSEQSAP